MHIALFAILTPILGDYADSIGRKSPRKALYELGGIHFTVIAVLLFINTFIPKGALVFNPKVLGTELAGLVKDVEMDTRTNNFESGNREEFHSISCVVEIEIDEISNQSPKKPKVRFAVG